MKKVNLLIFNLAFLASILFFNACTNAYNQKGAEQKKDSTNVENNGNSGNEGENEVSYSTHNSTESKDMSNNCLTCHYQGGSGEGVFTTGGTIYDSTQTTTFANATLYFYTDANGQGTLVDSLEVDAYGHFYTTQEIDFTQGLYPVVEGTNGFRNYMPSSTPTGACYSCHGTSTAPKIWVK